MFRIVNELKVDMRKVPGKRKKLCSFIVIKLRRKSILFIIS